MARQINESKALSKSDRSWLQSRGDYTAITRIDAAHGKDTDEESAKVESGEQVELARLAEYLEDNHPGATGQSAVDKAIALLSSDGFSAPQATGQSDPDALAEGNAEDESGPGDYSGDEWTNDALRDELGRRELSRSGNKDELRARLVQDDSEE